MTPVIKNSISEDVVFNPTQSLNLMRIIQEALNNARKYAEASELNITFRDIPDGIILEISDNGRGMEVDKSASVGNGFGNMKERAQLINAKFSISSTPGNGTHITLQIPHLP